ncbi:MAG: hypothetical protein K2L87_04435 [Clostridiales bacterium]|nr:hypothetical protein [Clostridiales bacterium]
MKQVSTKKRGAILACSALMAVSLTGGLAFLHGGVAASADETNTARAYYYVDAGNFVDGDGNVSDRGRGGDPSSTDTKYMEAHDLTYGTKEGCTTLYNSVTDKLYGEDETTHKQWGLSTPDAGDYGLGDWWRTGKTDATEATNDGYNTARHINEGPNNMGEGRIVYKFQVDDNTTPLKITYGTRTYGGGWGRCEFEWAINDLSPVKVSAENGQNSEYISSLIWSEPIVGVQEGDDYFVTLTFGEQEGQNTVYVNWILVSTVDYGPLTYGFPTYVEQEATTIQVTASDGTGKTTANLTEASQTAINNARPLDKVNVTIEVGDEEFTGTVTVLPKNIKYFVNLGGAAVGDLLIADGAYSAETGYGYTTGTNKNGDPFTGGAEYVDYPFEQSCRTQTCTLNYQFDNLHAGTYGVVVGATEHWAQWDKNRPYEIQATGGEKVTFNGPATDNASAKGVCESTLGANDASLTVNTKCTGNNGKQESVLTYILVYQKTVNTEVHNLGDHSNIVWTWTGTESATATTQCACGDGEQVENATVTSTRVEPTCTAAGSITYTAKITYNGQEYTNVCETVTPIDALGHAYDYEHMTWNWDGYVCTTATAACSREGCEETDTVDVVVTNEVTTAESCTTDGVRTYTATATVEEQTYTDTKTEAIAAHHTYNEVAWGEWTADYTITYSAACSVCGDSQDAAQATVTHVVTTAPTCTTTGVKTHTATAGTEIKTTTEELAALGHNWDYENIVWNWNEYECESATVSCQREGCTAVDTLDAVVTTTEVAATCEEGGSTTYTATVTVGDDTYTDVKTVTIDALGHTIVHVDAVAPTIEQAGNSEYWECSVCHTLYSDAEGNTVIDEIPVIPAQHTIIHHDAVAATCTTAGNGEYWQCEVCHKLFSDENGENEIEAVPTIAEGHTKVHHDAVAATCETAGAGEYWSCSVCNKLYSDEACTTEITAAPAVAAIGHDYTATWTWNGTEGATVKLVCKHDATHTKEATATITSEVTKEATKDEEGVTTYTAKATIDGKDYTDTKTAPIEKLEGGCGSAMSVGAMSGLAGLAAVCALVCLRKKEKNN